jgi:hypothetical protein
MEEGKFKMIMNILKFALGGIGIFACLWVLGTSSGIVDAEVDTQEAYREGAQMGLAINYTVIIFSAAVIGVVLFFIYQMITNTKKTLMSIIGIIAALVLYLILAGIGSSDTNASLALAEANQVEAGTISSSSAGLYTALIGLGVATVLALFGPFILGKYRK